MNHSSQKTALDWFRFRAKAEPRDILEAMRPMFGTLAPDLALKPLGRGVLGFQQAAQIVVEDLVLGRMDFGGESQRDWVRVDVPGKGCEWVQDWNQAQGVEQLPAAALRRVDVALTTWRGEVTHERVLEAHSAGRFAPAGAGRTPVLREITSTDPYAGRTAYIGSREHSPKFMRCYEKGWQLLADAGLSQHARASVQSLDGHHPRDIYRCEVEFKATTHDIPWSIVERPDEFFAGAYPFCQDVLPGVDVDLLARRPERAAQRSLQIALEHVRTQFGPTLYTALHAHGGDILAVWDLVVGKGHSQALLEAGVLLVEH